MQCPQRGEGARPEGGQLQLLGRAGHRLLPRHPGQPRAHGGPLPGLGHAAIRQQPEAERRGQEDAL